MTNTDSYTTELDNEINQYLELYKNNFEILHASSWTKYIYLMIDELLRNGLKVSDVMHIKQKYAEFRCAVETDDEKKQIEFDKIILIYTNKINSICELCEAHGIVQTIDGWQYRLCLKHFFQRKEPKLDKELIEELSYFQDLLSIQVNKQYQDASKSKYDAINDDSRVLEISIIHHILQKKEVDNLIIRKLLFDFIVYDANRFESDGVIYSKKTYFEDDYGNKIFPENNFYSNKDYLIGIINKICK